jgi:beta-glucosidase
MLRALRERGLEPLVTLNHFTLPQWVADRGGWLWEGIVPAFAAYAGRIVRAAGGLADFWLTLNEPEGYLASAYVTGRFPPGRRNPLDLVRAVVRSVRAHAAAYRAIHEVQPHARVSIAAYLRPVDPARPQHPLDRWLARSLDHFNNSMYLDALTTGRLVWPTGLRVNLPEAARSLDYVGVNYYTRSRVAFDLRRAAQGFIRDAPRRDATLSDGGYGEVYPDGLLTVLRGVQRYGLPVYVTENGLPDADDRLRPQFIVEHLRRVAQAIDEGCPVRGYYHWSIVDNFEWADGWGLRFGLYAMDPATQARTARPSAGVYADICRQNALP